MRVTSHWQLPVLLGPQVAVHDHLLALLVLFQEEKLMQHTYSADLTPQKCKYASGSLGSGSMFNCSDPI